MTLFSKIFSVFIHPKGVVGRMAPSARRCPGAWGCHQRWSPGSLRSLSRPPCAPGFSCVWLSRVLLYGPGVGIVSPSLQGNRL